MTDEQTRELQRKAAAGDVEAEAKLLLERVRAGDLTEDRLKLAAGLGDTASREALGKDAPEVPGSLSALAEALQHAGEEVRWRTAVVTARLMLPFWDATPGVSGVRESIAATETWLLCPCEEHEEEVRASYHAPPGQAVKGPGHADLLLLSSSDLLGPEDRVRHVISSELIPWVLGTGDPVRDRVEARQREVDRG